MKAAVAPTATAQGAQAGAVRGCGDITNTCTDSSLSAGKKPVGAGLVQLHPAPNQASG